MSPKKYHQNRNINKTEMPPKMKGHQNEMSPESESYQN